MNDLTSLDLRGVAVDLMTEGMCRPSVVDPRVVETALAGLTPEQSIGMAMGLRMAAEWLEHPEPDAADHAANVQALREMAAGAADCYLAG